MTDLRTRKADRARGGELPERDSALNPGSVWVPGSPEAKLVAIENDFERKWFTKLEENRRLFQWQQVWLQLHPETAKGVAGANAKHGHANDILSFAEHVAIKTNIDKRTVQRGVRIFAMIAPAVASELKLSKKPIPETFSEDHSEQLALVKEPADMQLNIIKVLLGTYDSKLPMLKPITSVAHAKHFLKHDAHIGKYESLIDHPFILGDSTDLSTVAQIKDGSVSLIATDMPYGKKWLHLLEPLFKLWVPKLTPDGHIAIMYGQDATPWFWTTVVPLMETYGMVYRGEMSTVTPKGGAGSNKNSGLMIHHWKPIAVFAKPHKFEHAVNDTIFHNSLSDAAIYSEAIYDDVVIGDSKAEKEYYDLQQKVKDFEVLISRLSADPSDLVVDPFAGSGTTCIAAHRTGRRTIGIEILESVFEIAKTRWAEEVLGKKV